MRPGLTIDEDDHVWCPVRQRRRRHQLQLQAHEQRERAPSTRRSPSIDNKSTDETARSRRPSPRRAFITCTASHTITQADLNAGSVVNLATGHANTAAGAPVDSNEDSETARAIQNPGLTLLKTATPSTYSSANVLISYSYKLTNSGNVTLYPPFAIVDNKSSDESCPQPATLAPGAFITCTASYLTTAGDVAAGSVTNTATGHGQFNQVPVNSNQDSETVTYRRPTSTEEPKPTPTPTPTAPPTQVPTVAPSPTQEVLAATDRPGITLPPTDSGINGDQASSGTGFGLMLTLLVLAGIGLVAGQFASKARRPRREEVRRR